MPLKNSNGLNLKLYFFPTSFYSQKVAIALHEKCLPFHVHVINLRTCEQLEPSFLKVNPEGKVPVLQDGVKIIPGSCRILDYLEDNFKNGDTARLYPPPGTPEHNTCKLLCQRISDINVELITFGVLQKRELTENCQIPQFISRNIGSFEKTKLEKIEATALKDPSLKDVCDKIREGALKNIELTRDEERVLEALDATDQILSDVEQQLTEVEKRSQSQISWLCGEQFTVADIHLGVLLSRLHALGLSNRFWAKALNRTHLGAYFVQISRRSSFRRYIPSYSLFSLIIKPLLQKAAPYLATILVGLLGIIIGYRYRYLK